jgi:RNA polymerase-binding transcription factor DksA
MADSEQMARLRRKLIQRRAEIVDRRGRNLASWQGLHEAEREYEETAQKENISQGLAQLDAQEKDEIEAIDRALRKMETGRYGQCQACGQEISMGRLDAIPYTPFCNRCAHRLERGRSPSAGEGEAPSSETALPADFAGMSDEGIADAIYEEIEQDGRVDTTELEITFDEGVVHLSGALAGEPKRYILLEIIEDRLGFPEVADGTRIDRTLWQREDTLRPDRRTKQESEVLMNGEDINEDVFESEAEGTPYSPPDRLIPET